MKGASWLNVVLGAWLIIAPWVIRYTLGSAIAEDVILGIAVVVVGLWSVGVGSEIVAPAWINVILGIWILIAPWVIGYAGQAIAARNNDVIMGILIVIFAGIRIATARRIATVGAPPR